MDPSFPSEQPSLVYNSMQNPNDTGYNYSAYQPPSKFLSGNLRGNGMDAGSSTSTPYLQPPHQLECDPCDGFENLSIQQSVPNTPNNQFRFDPQLRFPSNGMPLFISPPTECTSMIEKSSHAYGHRHLDIGTTAGWGDPSLHFVQGEIMNHLGPRETLSSYDPQGSSSQMTVGPAFSQSRVQYYLPHMTSFPPGQIQEAAQSHVVTQGQNTITQKASRQYERVERKRLRDKERKHSDRANDDQAYTRVCEILEIDQMPKNSLSQRILERVESTEPDYEKICELLDISMNPRDTLAHRILVVVQGLVERQRLEGVLRHQLKESEAYVRHLKTMLANFSTEADVSRRLPTNAPTMLGNSDTCATLPSWP